MLKPLTAALLLVIVMSGCENLKHDYKLHTIGIVKDVNVVATSVNESIKTQIKCDSLFFVVRGLPTIKIGYKINGAYDGDKLIQIYDANGAEYKVFN